MDDVVEILEKLLATFNGIHGSLREIESRLSSIDGRLEGIEIDLHKITHPPTDSH